MFDQFEILLALVYGDVDGDTVTPFWGPSGGVLFPPQSENTSMVS